MVKRNTKIPIAIIALFVFCCKIPVFPQQSETYSYEQLEKILKQNNTKLLAARYRIEAATHMLKATGPKFWPKLAFYYRYFPNGIAFQEGEIATKNWLIGRMTFDLVHFFRVRPLQKEEKQVDMHLAELALQELERDALFAFRKLYTHTLQCKMHAEYYAKLCSTSQKVLKLRRVQFDHQEALRSHLLEAEMELSRNTELLDHHQTEYIRGKRQLAAILRIAPDTFELKNSFFIPFIPEKKLLLQAAVARHTQSRKSALFIQKESARARASVTSGLTFEPYVGFRFRELRQGELESGPEIGFKLGMGLGYFTQRHHQKKYIEATTKAIQLENETDRHDVLIALNAAYSTLTNLQSAMQRSEEALAINLENLRIDEAIARHGIEGIDSTPLKMMQLQEENMQLQNQIVKQKTEYMDAYFEIMHLAGISWADVLRLRNQSLAETDEAPTISLWIWDTTGLLMENRIASALPNFCSDRHISKVYLSLPGDIKNNLANNPVFIRLLAGFQKKKIMVEALLGDPHWIFPSNRKNLLEKVDAVIDLHKMYDPVQLITGLHLDIEPHTLPGWHTNKSSYAKKFATTLQAVKKKLHEHNSDLPVDIDVPLQFSKLQKPLLQELFKATNAITIMAYARKSADKIAEEAQALINLCREQGKKYTIGLNAKDFGKKSEFEDMVRKIRQLFSADPNFAGIAIHSFSSWIHITEEQ